MQNYMERGVKGKSDKMRELELREDLEIEVSKYVSN
jgi:hypothetical protein